VRATNFVAAPHCIAVAKLFAAPQFIVPQCVAPLQLVIGAPLGVAPL